MALSPDFGIRIINESLKVSGARIDSLLEFCYVLIKEMGLVFPEETADYTTLHLVEARDRSFPRHFYSSREFAK